MLSSDELATIRAALRFWRDEIVPGGDELALLYLDEPATSALDRDQVDSLAECFQHHNVRAIRETPEGLKVSEFSPGIAGNLPPDAGTVVYGPKRGELA